MMNENLIKPYKQLIPKGLEDKEIVEKRGLRVKVFDIGNNKRRLRASISPAHYQEGGGWKEIDTTITADHKVQKAPYNLDIKSGKIGYAYESKKGGRVDVELTKIGDQSVDLSNATIRREGNVLFWEGVTSDLDLKLVAYPQKVEIFKLLKNENAPKKFTWRVVEDREGKCRYNPSTGGVDNSGSGRDSGRLEMKSEIKNTKEVSGRKEYEHIEEWTGRVSRIIDEKTRKRDWFEDPVYPVLIDASTSETVQATMDDVWEYYNTMYGNTGFYSEGYLYFGNYKGWSHAPIYGGVRFQSIGIGQGATILSATLNLYNHEEWGGDPAKVNFYADDVDNCSAWSTNDRPKNITKTTASQQWTFNTGWYGTNNSVPVTSLIQEVISRTGWASNNALRLMGQGTDTNTYYQSEIGAYDQGTTPTLDITYTASGGTETKNAEAQARIKQADISKLITSQARIKKEFESLVTAQGRVKQESLDSQVEAKGRIKSIAVEKDITSQAKVQKEVERAISGQARVKTTKDFIIEAQGRIKTAAIEKAITSRARVEGVGEKDVTAQARVEQKAVESVLSGQGRIKQAELESVISSLARLEQTNIDYSLEARGRVQVLGEENITAKSRINRLEEKIVTALARIKQVDLSGEVTGRARIFKAREKLLSAEARIEQLFEAKATAQAKVEQLESSLIEARARLKQAGSAEKIEVSARIQTLQTKIFSAKMRIEKIEERTATVRAKIQRLKEILATAQARIEKEQEVDVSAMGNIFAMGVAQEIAGRAKIKLEVITKLLASRAKVKRVGNFLLAARAEIIGRGYLAPTIIGVKSGEPQIISVEDGVLQIISAESGVPQVVRAKSGEPRVVDAKSNKPSFIKIIT